MECFPNARHLLFHWNIDNRLEQKKGWVNEYVLHVHFKLLKSAYRAWQKKCHVVIKSSDNKDKIYASLLSLLKEADNDRLTDINLLVEKWQAKSQISSTTFSQLTSTAKVVILYMHNKHTSY